MKTAHYGQRLGGLSLGFALVSLGLGNALAASSPPPTTTTTTTVTETASLETQRDFYNAGTRKLNSKDLLKAEELLRSAIEGQKKRLQASDDQTDESLGVLATALYNLGLVRFDIGVAELKKSPDAAGTNARGENAENAADKAIKRADDALAGDDIEKMVEAYVRGRGARKELREAAEAVRLAMEKHKVVLNKWQRSERDFKSAEELAPSAADAKRARLQLAALFPKDLPLTVAEASENGKLVDRHIAKLVDSLKQMQQCAGQCAGKKEQLAEKLKQLKGRIPAPNMPPGAAGEDDEDEDQKMGKEPGQKEGPSKQGQEMAMSPEQAGWLLQGFKLDSDRRLPMGEGQQGKPKDKGGPTW